MDLVIDTDIPFGAGLSSSAAFEIAVGLAVTNLSGHEISSMDLALAGQEVEHRFAGVRSGIMDQLVSASARDGNLLLIDCRSLALEHVPFEFPGLELVVCDSRVKHELASSAYNDRRSECEKGVEMLRRHFPEIQALRDVTVDELSSVESDLPPVIAKRCRHVVSENARTLKAVDAVKSEDTDELGRLMYESHASLRDDYEVSAPELDLLVETASKIDGVVGSRMTGGGFGGCTITLVAKEQFRALRDEIEDKYESAFGRTPAVFAVRPSPGADSLGRDNQG
jgi:galactokinase